MNRDNIPSSINANPAKVITSSGTILPKIVTGVLSRSGPTIISEGAVVPRKEAIV